MIQSVWVMGQKKLTNELIWTGNTFASERFEQGPSMNDGLHYTLQKSSKKLGDYIVKYSYATGDSVGLIASSMSIFRNAETGFGGYSFSADEKKILIETKEEALYRYSYYATYFIHDLNTGKTQALIAGEKNKTRLASFSPDGTKVAYVYDNNIFIYDLNRNETTAVTQDGQWNSVINGATDWVYEEEFALVQGYHWRPNSLAIAYLKFNETEVPEYGMDLYGQLYPERVTFKYPKAGEKNSQVSAHVFDLSTRSTVNVFSGKDADTYIPRFKWHPSDYRLFVYQMNRLQNDLNIVGYNIQNALSKGSNIPTAEVLYKESSKTYIDINDNFYFLQNQEGFIITSEQDGFQHLYHYDNTGKLKKQITQGAWEVVDVYGLDEKNNVYYSASENTIGKSIQRVNLKGKTETWMGKKYDGGTYDASFSKGMKYCIITHSNANQPSTITLHNETGSLLRTLVANEKLKSTMADYCSSKKEFMTFTLPQGHTLNAWMMKPQNMEKDKKYPVVFVIYGGPGRNTVMDMYEGRNYLWHQMLTQQGYIVVSVDPRGTQYRGRDFKHSTYMQLGKNETEDFIEVAKLMSQMPFVDGSRINMQGWSFGGYMTSLCMTKGAEVFHAGIAVAPVTNWKYYDSIYTERFLRTPQENKSGYEDNSPVNYAKMLNGPFLLVHGSADDNVHYQNAMDFAEALIQANKPFDFFSYPNKNHGIAGGKTRLHLFEKMTQFLLENGH